MIDIESDALCTYAEQEKLAKGIRNSVCGNIESLEGHVSFLLSTKQVSSHLLDFMYSVLPDLL